ncbi:AMP-binding protein [Neiella marina]|uniref:AMP-binding protein n=1 Tax=Neiella holothuriorum TaxID=2870530 RepID=A0ABS7EIW0_9GAMM|nr:AMP-binding protein [Neiella holothuriorum]MBW8192225.1 AMP-binding protein [Neiella holothuriorum]
MTNKVGLIQPNENPAIYRGTQNVSGRQWCHSTWQIAARLKAQSSTGRLAVCHDDAFFLVLLAGACLAAGWTFVPISYRWPQAARTTMANQACADYCWPSDAFDESLPALADLIEIDLFDGKRRRNNDESFAAPQAIEADLTLHASVLFTSGSSGQPKAVLHQLQQHWAAADYCNPILQLSANSCWLASLPLFHAAGYSLLIRCLRAGAVIALPPATGALTDLLQQLQQAPITHCSLVATQLQRLLETPKFHADNLTLRHIMLGGGPVSDASIQQASERGFKLYLGYGMTESGAAIALSAVTTKAHIDVTGLDCLRVDSQGQIQLRGAQLACGYLAANGLTPLIDSQGWFATGDVAELSAGKLIIRGRADNQFISGGENIQPEMVEQVLRQHTDIEQVLVVAADDREFGKRPVAFVRWHQRMPNLTELQAWLASQLPKFMWPIHWLDWPPEQDSVKPNRQQLAALAAGKILSNCHNASNGAQSERE